MPNKKNIKKWVEALRSRKYKQGQGSLKVNAADQTFHCCLGVACEVYTSDTGKGKWDVIGSSFRFFDRNSFHASYLPPTVQEWLGIDAVDPTLKTSGCIAKATELNDGYDTKSIEPNDFDQIADAIERTYLK